MRFRIDYHSDDVPRYVTEAEAQICLRNVFRQDADWSLQWERLLRWDPVELTGSTIRRVDGTN